MSVLAELQEAVAAVATAAAPSVVGIGSRTRGSGVVIADGAVLTNAHNLRGGEVTVRFADGRATRGTVAGVDWDGDLAVVSVDTAGTTPIAWSYERRAPSGPPCSRPPRRRRAARASRSGSSRPSSGRSAARAAAASPARSSTRRRSRPARPGSALLDAEGALVGLNTNRVGEGFYLALPADGSLKARVDALARGESKERPRLGIAVAPAHVARRLRRSVGLPERDGVLVRGVEDGSPAAAAGIAEGDLLVAAAGKPIDDVDALHEILRDAGFPLELTLVRGTEERTVTVQAPPPADDSPARVPRRTSRSTDRSARSTPRPWSSRRGVSSCPDVAPPRWIAASRCERRTICAHRARNAVLVAPGAALRSCAPAWRINAGSSGLRTTVAGATPRRDSPTKADVGPRRGPTPQPAGAPSISIVTVMFQRRSSGTSPVGTATTRNVMSPWTEAP